MKATKQGLHKLTETDIKINTLLAQKTITQIGIDKVLSLKQKQVLGKVLTRKLNELKGIDRDEFLEKIEEIIPADAKNQLWENNHYQIISAITKFIEEYGRMPTKNRISEDTGLSRQTIHKHLKNYSEHPLFAEQLKQFRFMADRVLAKVVKAASLGDMKAARLYFDVMGNYGNQTGINTTINTQNNYIQINQTKLSQEIVQQLTPEQLNQIEAVLNSVSKFDETVK